MLNIIATIVSVLFSGLLATFITIRYQIIHDERQAKRNIFETAASYRYFRVDEVNVKALNSIDVVFYNNKPVMNAWRAYLDEADKADFKPETLNDKYIKLLEEMAIACNYKNIKWDNLKRFYYPTGLSSKKTDEELLNKLQIRAALSANEVTVNQGNTPQQEQFSSQLLYELLPRLIEHPDSLEKLISISQKVDNPK